MFKKLLISVVIGFSMLPFGSAQTRQELLAKLDHQSSAYRSGKLSKSAYLDSINVWLSSAEQHQIFFPADSMEMILSLYKNVAQSDTALAEKYVKYYVYLANNQSLQGHDGMAIYYLNKYDKANQLLLKKRSLSAFALTSRIYSNLENYSKVLEIYDANKVFLYSYPRLIDNDSISKSVAINSVLVLNAVANAYVQAKNLAGVDSIIALAKAIQGSYLKKVEPQSMHAFIVNINLLNLQFIRNFDLLNDLRGSKRILDQERQLIYDDTTQSTKRSNWFGTDYYTNVFRYHLKNHSLDSAAHYLKIFRAQALVNLVPRDLATCERDYFEAAGQYDSAYNRSQLLLAMVKQSRIELSDDRDDLLTAFIEAEENRDAIKKAEEEKQRKNAAIVIISVVSAIAVFSGFYIIGRTNRRMKKQITQLNTDVEVQVSQLEEVAENARRKEQLKLGTELHDNMAARLAALVFMVDAKRIDATDTAQAEWLRQVKEHLSQLYNDARARSHNWAEMGKSEGERSFSKTIETLLNNALPDKVYQKEILIDDDTLRNVPAETRIELLYIIREAIINILKHAKATLVSITMYEDDDKINLAISDNGKGFEAEKFLKNNANLGLNSIQERVKKLNGLLRVVSGRKGTNITVLFPSTSREWEV